jgi:hypothetical protein
MKKEYLVSIPANITSSNTGINFYDKVKSLKSLANNLKEVYYQYPHTF